MNFLAGRTNQTLEMDTIDPDYVLSYWGFATNIAHNLERFLDNPSQIAVGLR